MSEEAKVVALRSGVAIHQGVPTPDVVAELEDWLERARSGDVIGVGIVAYNSDKSTGSRRAGTISRSMVGQCFALMQRMTMALDE